MYKNIFSFILLPVLLVALAFPAPAKAATNYYQYQTQSEQLAYLYGVIAQLQAQLLAMQGYSPVTNPNYVYYPNVNTNTNNSSEISRITTGNVYTNNNNAVTFKGEVFVNRNNKARVWFEYGANTNLTNSTRSAEVRGNNSFEISTPSLDGNRTYYYRAVAEDSYGRYAEGQVKSFRLGSSNNYYDDNYNDDWSLEVDDNYYDTGDNIRVDYEVGDRDSKNWIGLYKVGASDKNYITSKYVRSDDGYVTFRINQRGEYEFRLFSNDSFDLEAESDSFEVGY